MIQSNRGRTNRLVISDHKSVTVKYCARIQEPRPNGRSSDRGLARNRAALARSSVFTFDQTPGGIAGTLA